MKKRGVPSGQAHHPAIAATWLTDQVLLVATALHPSEIAITAIKDGAKLPLAHRAERFGDRTILWLRASECARDFDLVSFFQNRKAAPVTQAQLSAIAVAPMTFAREQLAPLDCGDRERAMNLLASALSDDLPIIVRRRLGRALFEFREVLRERLPLCIPQLGNPLGLQIESLLAVDEKSFYVRGWCRDGEAELASLTAVSPEGARAELLDGAFHFQRADVHRFYHPHPSDSDIKFGFIRFFSLPFPSTLGKGWVFEMRSTSGEAVEVDAPEPVSDIVTVRDTILQDLAHERPHRTDLILNHAHPAIVRLQERRHALVKVEDVAQYGTAPAAPAVSIIIPLYKRIDFLEQQLAQFADDPEIARADLIYVLDSPELAEQLSHAAPRLGQLYGVAFRIVTLDRNGGFSAANNIGVSFARSPMLLLMNSDVLPDRPGWLGKMVAFYKTKPSIGALGPKLLFEDDTLQHAGLYFAPLADSAGWENMHFFKGLHRTFPPANVARRVPAVTAACMMISRKRYDEVGGLRGSYVQGDYEDSDLCLRLSGAGCKTWYLPEVELYHLEGQSYALPLRQLTGRYNRWLHTHLWADRIRAVTAECGLSHAK